MGDLLTHDVEWRNVSVIEAWKHVPMKFEELRDFLAMLVQLPK